MSVISASHFGAQSSLLAGRLQVVHKIAPGELGGGGLAGGPACKVRTSVVALRDQPSLFPHAGKPVRNGGLNNDLF